MLFHEFLQDRQKYKKFASAKEHYESLGGESKLGITLRHFQLICSGTRNPTEKLLNVIFNQVDATDKRPLVLSFFKSVLSELGSSAKSLNSYLEEHLSPAISGNKASIWETAKSTMFLNVEQMEFLIASQSALSLYQRATLFGETPIVTSGVSSKTLIDLERLGLIHCDKKTIRPSRTLFRIPTIENSSSSVAKYGTELILKIMNLYLSKEGHPFQKIHLRIQFVSPSVADRVLEQFDDFNKWVQSQALDIDNCKEDYVPLLFFGMTKKLGMNDL